MARRLHRMPFGAEPQEDGAWRFRLWAPAADAVSLMWGGDGQERDTPMVAAGEGWFECALGPEQVGHGALYRYRASEDAAVPDPASRYQPQDVHGPSALIDPRRYEWRDSSWRGRPWEEAVLYELHPGCFSGKGSYDDICRGFDHLAEIGVTAVELMPLADTPGARNWGYDGVYPFAPDARHGTTEALKRLVDAAHERGLMVLLDVVYNHFGPEGNYLHQYAPQFFTERHRTPWGAAINFDGPESRWVREFFIHNALYWLTEYHFDGLRLDAVHAIYDEGERHILPALAERVHQEIGSERHVHLVLENDRNEARWLERTPAGRPRWYVAQWNDDFHHALHVLLTGEGGGYYEDYAPDGAAHLGRALAEGFAYQGEPSRHRDGEARGTSSAHLPPTAFVNFLQNHDQVGNRALGERITALASDDAVRAAVAVLLLAPSPPLLFMGEEWAAAQPFPFFCDFGPDLTDAVREGRRREFSKFPEFRDPAARERIPAPDRQETYRSAVLNWADPQREPHKAWLFYYRQLLDIRAREIVPRLAGIAGGSGRHEKLGERALRATWRLGDGSQLSVLANLGAAEVSAVDVPPGELLFETPSEGPPRKTGTLPAWSAYWYLQEGAEGDV